MNIADLRQDYRAGELHTADLDPDPIQQFSRWFDHARDTPGIGEVNAMTLATSTRDGEVTARVVLLKGFGPAGFRFFTNSESRKGRQIAENPRVALAFHWAPLERQVLITGNAARISPEESTAYFHSRPRDSQLGAWASQQSRPAAHREDLDAAFEQVRRKFVDREIPLPPFWGGYRVSPISFEFWQGRTGRLHDRFHYELQPNATWQIRRLQP